MPEDPAYDPYSEFLVWKWLPDGRFAGVVRLTFGRARIVIGVPPPFGYDDVW